MSSSASRVAIPALLLSLRVSAYTLAFYGNAGCSGAARWQHKTTNDSTYMTPCEPIPAAAGNGILSAVITGDATDNHWGYTAQLFSDPACNSQATLISSDGGCESTGSGIRSFIVVGTESDFQMPEGQWDTVSYTVNTVESIDGDAVYNETDQYYETDNYGAGGSSSSSSGSSSSVSYDSSSDPGAAVPVMYPLDDASLEYAISNDDEAGIPGGIDEAVLGADCGDTVQEKGYAVDEDGNGLADGSILETTTTDPSGNIVRYQKQEQYGQDIPGAIMDGPVVQGDPTLNDPRVPDPVLDNGSSGTLTSTGWPAVVLSRE
ncbi:hypothetical protein TWF481_006327 [Arthrobotrys musiformis]|uniref:Uncharacterized protein n=1 Tax=Arthrobotrys musiformis TaxID=47236 RepID=A0AAV9WHJ2_9PEZI